MHLTCALGHTYVHACTQYTDSKARSLSLTDGTAHSRHSPWGSENHRRSRHPEHICGPALPAGGCQDPEQPPGRGVSLKPPFPDQGRGSRKEVGRPWILHLDDEVLTRGGSTLLTWVEETGPLHLVLPLKDSQGFPVRPCPPLPSHHRLTFCRRLDQCPAHAGRPLEAPDCHSTHWSQAGL